MAFFAGYYIYTVDRKGRVNIPASFRKHLPEKEGESNVYLMVREVNGFSYLTILPQEYFQEITKEIADASGGPINPNPEGMRALLKLMNSVQECHYDDQGRLIIPRHFLEMTHIKDRVRIIGTRDYLQLWDPDTHDQYVEGKVQKEVEPSEEKDENS